MEEDDDESLVRRSLHGDDLAYAALAGRYRSRVAAMVSRFTRDRQAAEDLVQEVFLQAWRKLGQYRGQVPFEHWLTRISTRKCYDHLRKRHRNREDLLEPAHWEHLPTGTAPESRENCAEAARELLGLAMARLSAEERLVITLLELEEKSLVQTSDLTGWSVANVKVRAFRARQKLKTILQNLNPETQ